MKAKLLSPIFLISLLTSCSCSSNYNELRRNIYCFSTGVDIRLFEGSNANLDDLTAIFENVDRLTDNYLNRPGNNVYTINNSLDTDLTLESELYDLINKAINIKTQGAEYFDLLSGSLNKKWKESLEKNEVLSNAVIEEELAKMAATNITLKKNNVINKSGEAEIDLGGIAKGYSLDLVKNYLKERNLTKYMINAGRSSVLLGEYYQNDGYFTIDIEDVPGFKFRVKNCIISTSSTSVQGKMIGGITYSHIINPKTGSAINNFDAVVVISDLGYVGDAFSTSMMMNTVDEIKQIETQYNVKCLTIKNHQVTYYNTSIEVVS